MPNIDWAHEEGACCHCSACEEVIYSTWQWRMLIDEFFTDVVLCESCYYFTKVMPEE